MIWDGDGDTLALGTPSVLLAVELWMAQGLVPGEPQGAVLRAVVVTGCQLGATKHIPGCAMGWVTPELVHHGSLISLHKLLLHLSVVAPGEDPGPGGAPSPARALGYVQAPRILGSRGS